MKIFGISGWSGSGKTTLIERLIPLFTASGVTVSLIKHAHHSFETDLPGKDSWRHRRAGCTEVLVSSSRRWALVHELRGAPEPSLGDLTRRLSSCDLLLVEGFKREKMDKLEVHRSELGEPLIHPHDADVVAVAATPRIETTLPQFHLDDAEGIAQFILAHTGLR